MAENPDTITTARLKQLCDLNVPYHGYVDDGYGTAMYIDEMRLDERTAEYEGVLHYSKSISIKSTKVLHTVKAGDNLWAIARKLNVTVDQIVLENNIRTPDLIRPGDVLNIKTDIQYGYSVNSSVDSSAFKPQAKGYQPISDTDIYEGLDYLISAEESMATSLKNHAGQSTIGNNRRIYWERPSGRAFYGNQYVKTYSLSNIGRAAGRITSPRGIPLLSIVVEGVEIYDGYMLDGGSLSTVGHNTGKQIFGMGGALVGGALGVKAGAAVGALFGGAGAVPGAVIGGFVLGIVGGFIGEKGMEALYEEITDWTNDGKD